MAVVCPDLQLLFLCVPRTGCTSVAAALTEHYGGRWIPEDHILLDPSGIRAVDYKHSYYRDLVILGLLTPEQQDTYQTVAATRNPFDFVVSEYLYYRERYADLMSSGKWQQIRNWRCVQAAHEFDFDDYVETIFASTPPVSVVYHFIAGAPCLTLLRFENLAADFRAALQTRGVANPAILPKLNVSPTKIKPYQAYYSPASREIIARVFAQDLKQFHYTFDGQKDRRVHRAFPAVSSSA